MYYQAIEEQTFALNNIANIGIQYLSPFKKGLNSKHIIHYIQFKANVCAAFAV